MTDTTGTIFGRSKFNFGCRKLDGDDDETIFQDVGLVCTYMCGLCRVLYANFCQLLFLKLEPVTTNVQSHCDSQAIFYI